MSFAFTKWLQSNYVQLMVLKETDMGSFLFVLNHLLSPPLGSHDHSYGRYTSETPLTGGPISRSYLPLLNVLII